MASSDFSVVPASASLRINTFSASVPDSDLTDFKQLLRLSKIGPKTYENQQRDRRFGIMRDWLEEAKQHWEHAYDWRKAEARINSFPNFTTPINDDDGENYNIHFAALFSHKADAVPLVFLHGWPGNFLEFLPILDILRKRYKPQDLPFHVIVPSLPGYAYSTGPRLSKDFGVEDAARIVNKLMVGLGFGGGYVAQGGDIGSLVARVLAVEYGACKAVHFNFMMMPRPGDVPDEVVTPAEKKGLQRAAEFASTGNAYAKEQGTRPATIGLALSASPLALLAWIGEKYQQWTDKDPSLDTILDSVTLYWFTQSYPRCIYTYRQSSMQGRTFHGDPKLRVKKPGGFSWFPLEIAPTPKAWVEGTMDLKFWRAHDSVSEALDLA
ncbi:MAG: hypothetical protein Q9162_000410 [Coniocarpon cinnabarinum]